MTEQNVIWKMEIEDRVEQLNSRIMAILRVLGSQKTEQEKLELIRAYYNVCEFTDKNTPPVWRKPHTLPKEKGGQE